MKRSPVAASLGVLTAFALIAATAAPAHSEQPRDVGIWYSTWWSKIELPQTTWHTGFGVGSTEQFVQDVTGDGRADAVTFTSGNWHVGTSTGQGFTPPSLWISGHGAGSQKQLMADVNGDGKSDAVVFFNGDPSGDGFAGDWYAAVSTGSNFANYSLWKSGHGQDAKVLLGDVTGDGRADAVAAFPTAGQWGVAASSTTAFGASQLWASGQGTGDTDFFLGDVNGDGKADAVSYKDSRWLRSLSSGSSFGSQSLYSNGHGSGSDQRILTDGNNDGFAEPYAYFRGDVGLYPADQAPGDLVAREYNRAARVVDDENTLINSGFGANATKLFMASVDNDEYKWKNVIAFYEPTGVWQVQRYRQADTVSTNTWGGFPFAPAIKYRPLTLGSYQTYDSGDSAVIDEHLQTISDAKIDYLLLDETNNLNNVSGAILNRAEKVANRISAWNDMPGKRTLRYAFAIGGIQWSNDVRTIEDEARQTWDEFASDPVHGGNDHYSIGGKPLLIVYTTKANQNAWLSYTGDKSATNQFTVRFASSDPNATGGEYGWQLPATGTVDNASVMLAMPGWNNHRGNTPVSRDNGQYYSQKVWDVILARNPLPNSVIINSFNEFGEDTGMQIADTSQLDSTSEKWYNQSGVIQNDLYWQMTVNYIQQYKSR